LLTLIVTPPMLMVFTRANRKSDQRSLLARFGRTAKSEEAASADQPTQAVPEIAYPKAAE
jgi:hypothetical protein